MKAAEPNDYRRGEVTPNDLKQIQQRRVENAGNRPAATAPKPSTDEGTAP